MHSSISYGRISDMYDRRKVIVFSTFGAAIFSIFSILYQDKCIYLRVLQQVKLGLYFFLLFSFCGCNVFIILAHTNDIYQKEICCCEEQTSICWIRCNKWTFFMFNFHGLSWFKWFLYFYFSFIQLLVFLVSTE